MIKKEKFASTLTLFQWPVDVSGTVLLLLTRWSHRTATTQRRKDRHRQQTEHLNLDNDLKEVENVLRLALRSLFHPLSSL